MVSSNSNQLGINLHAEKADRSFHYFLERKLMDTVFVYRRERKSTWIPLNTA